MVIPPIAANLDHAKNAEDIHQIIIKLRAELNKYGLQDKEKIGTRAEKVTDTNFSQPILIHLLELSPPQKKMPVCWKAGNSERLATARYFSFYDHMIWLAENIVW